MYYLKNPKENLMMNLFATAAFKHQSVKAYVICHTVVLYFNGELRHWYNNVQIIINVKWIKS